VGHCRTAKAASMLEEGTLHSQALTIGTPPLLVHMPMCLVYKDLLRICGRRKTHSRLLHRFPAIVSALLQKPWHFLSTAVKAVMATGLGQSRILNGCECFRTHLEQPSDEMDVTCLEIEIGESICAFQHWKDHLRSASNQYSVPTARLPTTCSQRTTEYTEQENHSDAK
jgi:hypothetical protein